MHPKMDGVLESSLYVSDLPRSVGFYHETFGFSVISDFGELMDGLVPQDGTYAHDDLEARTENLEDDPHDTPNGWAHCRQALIGSLFGPVPPSAMASP